MSNFGPRDTDLQVARGKTPAQTGVNKFGRSPDIGTAAALPKDVWDVSNSAYNWMTSASALDVSSSSTADDGDPAGTGAQTIKIEGLDSSWNAQTETVTMDGTSTVTTSNTWIRVNRAYVVTAGSGDANAGNITIQVTGGGATVAYIGAGNGQTLMAVYTVPNGKKLYLRKMRTEIIRQTVAAVIESELWQRNAADTSTDAWRIITTIPVHSYAPGVDEWEPYNQITGKTDIRSRVSYASANNLVVASRFKGTLVDD